MMKKLTVAVLGLTLFVSGCGGGNNNAKGGGNEEESNIQYLKTNHDKYSKTASNSTPTPIKNSSTMSLAWSITAETETNAIKLTDHINFMVNKLKNDKNPRAWDKLFLLEAFMKTKYHYTTSVNRINKNVLIEKTATDICAYKVISAHSDAVSGDFFAQGVINKDYSIIAEGIINSSDCATLKSELESYIVSRQKSKGQ